MNINRHTLLFFDASCLIAAAGSPTGGSGFLLSLCTRSLLRGAISKLVLVEVEQNILAKMSGTVLERYEELLQTVPLTIVSTTAWDNASWIETINAKDQHVIAAALAAKSPFLLTLDRNLIVEVNRASMRSHALTPGDFIRDVLPNHSEFPQLR